MSQRQSTNPYARFLGLPESVTQPDHYELLGLERFTDDPIAIRDAATAQNAKLRKWENNDELYQQARQVTMEVAQAMTVLIDATKREAYNQTLSQSIPAAEIIEEVEEEPVTLEDEILAEETFPQINKDFKVPRWAWGLVGTMGILFIGWTISRSGSSTTSDRARVVTSGTESSPSVAEEGEQLNRPEEVPTPPPPNPEPLIAPFDEATAKNRQQAWADYLGREVVETNSIDMKLVLIPPGEFQMGAYQSARVVARIYRTRRKPWVDEHPNHPVRITEPFYLGQYEVTQRQWQLVMETTPWRDQKSVKEGPNYPATYVSWEDAIQYCKKLTIRERASGNLPSDWKYTLPTEAQWEYSCRAGTTTAFSFGNKKAKLSEYAWFKNNAKDKSESFPHMVGTKKVNQWGLCDMHGNVWELTADWYAEHYFTTSPVKDPPGPTVGSKRVARSGGWGSTAGWCRSANRVGARPSYGSNDVGFRVALVFPELR